MTESSPSKVDQARNNLCHAISEVLEHAYHPGPCKMLAATLMMAEAIQAREDGLPISEISNLLKAGEAWIIANNPSKRN